MQMRLLLTFVVLCAGCAGRPVAAPAPAPPSSAQGEAAWREVPAATVTLGSPASEPERDEDEGPQHQAAIAPFRMMAAPVTVAAFEALGAQLRAADPEARFWTEAQTPAGWPGQCNLGSERRDHPANCVDFRAARAFCRAVGGDLPAEGQWEAAARAGTRTAFWWGDGFEAGRAVTSVACGKRGCLGGTAPVATSGPRCNPLGLCDLTGQVWEWTQTGYQESQGAYVLDRDDGAPARPVLRGGSWQNHLPFLLRNAKRGLNYPDHGMTGVGFRCVRST